MCLQCNNTCDNAPDEDIGDLENDKQDPDKINLDLLSDEMDREEDSQKQTDGDPGEKSDTKTPKILQMSFTFINLSFSLYMFLTLFLLFILFILVH